MIKRFFNLLFRIILWFLVVTVGWVFVYKFIKVPVTVTMISNAVKNIGSEEAFLWKYDWTPIESVSPHLQMAVVAAEDQKFPEHFGFDFDAMEKALENNEKGGRVKGGSTISQQTAKNAFLWQGRTYIRKGLEAYFTALIELIWGKKRILEVYVNVAEMGPGIYGAQAAAQHYFNKDAAQLSAREAAILAAILPSPKTYSVKNPGPYVRRRQTWILRQMRNLQGTELY
jgi:monofunctional biosynthetic peptidoglycan transglycosylase